MLDRGITADLLEENLQHVEREMQENRILPMAMRSAMRQLREGAGDTLYSAEEAEAFAGAFGAGAEIACYLERRGYYKPEGCIAYALREGLMWISTSSGTAEGLRMRDYGRSWRLWSQYPAGEERNRARWKGAEA